MQSVLMTNAKPVEITLANFDDRDLIQQQEDGGIVVHHDLMAVNWGYPCWFAGFPCVIVKDKKGALRVYQVPQ